MGIKFLDFEKRKIVSISDDAIDKEKTDIGEYQKEYDVSKLVFKESETPTYFVIANITGPDQVSIQQEHYKTNIPQAKVGMTQEELKLLKVNVTVVDQGGMLVKYFKAGCKSYIDNGKEVEINDEVLQSIPGGVIQEIGSFLMTKSILNESKKK